METMRDKIRAAMKDGNRLYIVTQRTSDEFLFEVGEYEKGVMFVRKAGPFSEQIEAHEALKDLMLDKILDALREPTEEMLKAGRAANRLVPGNALGLECIAPDSAWKTMIDAAKEGK